MPSINPYLNFAGNTEEAFTFYQSVFGGELSIMRFSDTPAGADVPSTVKDKVMHASLPIGKDNILMATDACEEMGFNLKQGNNHYICISPDSKEEADKLFNSLAEDGKINMPLADMFWGAYYGDLTDKFGIQWMVNYQKH
ncbi:MAG TPA: VOC family protein [Parafilimonas sp.]|nr:VOC family protein [Parafilimonas sp.]